MKHEIKLGKNVRIGENVVMTGKVVIGDNTSIWHNVVLRGDVEPIIIGQNCNIQDNTVMHGQTGQFNVTIGDNVSIGHSCLIHGAQLEDHSFIGMGSMVMNGSYIGSHVFIAAGSLVAQNSRFQEEYSLIMGRPGKLIRTLKENEIEMLKNTPLTYIQYAKDWLPVCEEWKRHQ